MTSMLSHHQGVADPVGGGAIVALVTVCGAGGIFVQALGVFGSGDVPRPLQCLGEGAGQLVLAHHKDDPLFLHQRGGHPVAPAVDVQ